MCVMVYDCRFNIHYERIFIANRYSLRTDIHCEQIFIANRYSLQTDMSIKASLVFVLLYTLSLQSKEIIIIRLELGSHPFLS
jgi:hypothetical protein